MSWKDLTIGKKISLSFGVILVLLVVLGLLNFFGVGGIVRNAKQVIEGNKLDGMLAQKEVDHLNWSAKVNALLTDDKVTKLAVQTDDHKCGFGKWLYGEGRREAEHLVPSLASLLKEIEIPHQRLHESAIAIDKSVKQAKGMNDAKIIYAQKTMPALVSLQELLKKIRTEARKNIMADDVMLSSAKSTKVGVSVIAAIAVIMGMLLAFFTTRGIVGLLQNVARQMDSGSTQVASASGNIASASQSLAEGASQQAAATEESASSLEEMTSMTRKNADSAKEADSLMKEASGVIATANGSMQNLTISMEEISKASEDTFKIIKTIDEIAFQTNLLALNAAVEAARAGEAGAGFAVVADEVRNLAMRAAEAAKNTSTMIEDTVQKVKQGGELVGETNKSFTEVSTTADKVKYIVGEIAAASKEQATGLDQVNKAISEIDSVTQQNAASAEEAASASEELSAQAQTMSGAVRDLLRMVGALKAGSASGSQMEEGAFEKSRPVVQKRLAAPPRYEHTKPSHEHTKPRHEHTRKASTSSSKKVDPEKVIPMDDEDFQDF